MPLTPEDVQNKRFAVTRFRPGYDEDEVDAFLDEVEAELNRLLQENTNLRSQIQAAHTQAAQAQAQVQARPAQPTAPAEPEEEAGQQAALRTLLLAQRTADEAVAQARKEAEQMLADARGKATSLEQEARDQHATTMTDLDRKRRELERQVEDLRAFEREYRVRLKAYLETQLNELEGRGAGSEPPGAPVTPPSGRAPAGPAGSGPGGAAGAAPPAPTRPEAGAATSPFSRSSVPAPESAPPAGDAEDADVRAGVEIDEGPEVPPSTAT